MNTKPMYFITILQKWSNVPLHNRVATQGTAEECLDCGREMVEDAVSRMSNEHIQYELSSYRTEIDNFEITITYNIRSVDPEVLAFRQAMLNAANEH